MRKHQAFAMRTIPFVIAAAVAGNAFAQDKMDEVVVSAQKRTQRIQDVPMAISAISGQALEDRKIEGAADLQGSVPNLNVVAAPVSGLIAATSIRGLGTGQPSIWMDPAVGMYVDGVFVGKNQGALLDMLDLERVEVLRGPQGTLFGRNTLGGAVNFVTRKPSGQFSGNVGVEMGNYGRMVQRLSVDTPKTQEGLSFTIAARQEKQDGWLNNPTAGTKWGNRDRNGFKINALLEVSRDTQLTYSYDQSTINETTTPMSLISKTGYCSYVTVSGCFPAFFNPGLGAAINSAVQAGVPTSTSSTLPPIQNLKVNGHTWGFETALDSNKKLKYIGSARSMTYRDQGDYDGSAANVFTGKRATEYSTLSHELQLTGTAKDINYVTGLYYFKDNGNTIQDQIGGFFSFNPAAPMQRQTNFGLGTEAKAIFGQLDYALSKDLTLTGGLRYTTEEKTGSIWRTGLGVYPGATPAWTAGLEPGAVNAKATFSSMTPTLALSQKINGNDMVFGRIAKGFKSGGFPLEAVGTNTAGTIAAATTPFEPEKSTSYEVGYKGANGAASYAATAFLTKLTNQQISYLPVGSTSPTVTNAGASTYKGFELEGAVRVTKDTKVQASYGYLKAQFDSFMAAGIANSGAMVDAASNLVVGYAPKNTLNMNVESRLANTSLGRLKGMVEYRYVSSYYNYPANVSMTAPNAIPGNYAPDSKMPALGIVNARLTLDQIKVGGPGQMDVSLWVRNWANKQTMQNMMDVSGYYQVGYWSAPRTAGITANYKW